MAMHEFNQIMVSPCFDSGRYTGAFNIYHKRLNSFDLTFEEFDELAVLLMLTTYQFLKSKKNKYWSEELQDEQTN